MVNARLHPRTIEAVKERADIVDVVGEHVVLKKKGREFVGICPFHDDSKPSMTVSPAKQFYYCFSCGAGGNSIKFLMEFQRQSFSDVVLDLARRYQLPIETVDGSAAGAAAATVVPPGQAATGPGPGCRLVSQPVDGACWRRSPQVPQ